VKDKRSKIKSIIALALSGFLFSFAVGGAGAKDNVAAPSVSVQQAVTAQQRGTLFRVHWQHNTAYLFGTIHVGQSSFFPLEPQVTDALKNAGTLAVEFDIRNRAALLAATKKHALYPEGDSIVKHIAPETMNRLNKALFDTGIPFDTVAQMRPWMIANLLVAVTLAHNGYDGQNGIDEFLLDQATAQHKTVRELESADYQMSMFANMPEKEQENYLAENLADLASGKLIEQTRALANAWNSADGPTFVALSREELDEKTTSAKFMQSVLLDKRNPEMATKIEALLKNNPSTFVGVGMLHLIGSNGIPELLRKHGYAVEKIY
jgi:uncharacterized protein YbaP (TraB family)